MQKILLVCMGNICRSPIAEGVLRASAERAGLSRFFRFDSAGTVGTHRGEAPDPRAIAVAAARGYDLSRLRAKAVRKEDFADFDLILAMDCSNMSALEKYCPEQFKTKLFLFLPYAGINEPAEVPDPYYGNVAGFERVLDLCELAAASLMETGGQKL